MPATISFFDMSVSVTPPGGHFQPMPLTLGPNWQPNDVRLLFVSYSATAPTGDNAQDVALMMTMTPDPPTGFTQAYAINSTPGIETRGVYYRYLVAGDADTSVSWPKPAGTRDFMFAIITARGVNTAVAPVAGTLSTSLNVGDPTVAVSSVTVPAAGDMVFCLENVPDPEGLWGSWAVSMGVPTGWTPLVATDQSGATYFAYGTNPSAVVIGKNYSTSGTTGSVAVPVAKGAPAFAGMYVFVRPAPDVSVSVGVA